MENKAHAIAAGTFVLVVASLLVALAVWLTRDSGERDVYELSTREAVSGLQAQAAVRYRGIDVGKVLSIGFDPKVPGNVLVRIGVDKGTPVTRSTFATLGFQGVTGLSFVQLDDTGTDMVALVPNEANPPRIPLKPGLLAKLTEQGEKIMAQVEQATTRLNALLKDDNQKALVGAVTQMGDAAASVNKLALRLDDTVVRRVDPLMADMGKTLSSARNAADQIGETAANFNKTVDRLNAQDGPIDRLADGAATLSHAAETFGAATLPRVNRVTEDTARAMRRLSRTVNGINDNPQSLIFGNGSPQPGPGEPGFVAPGARP
jgi:phospholipid/cholesterol/gamma-HCH transport system substrate-binding protein